MSDIVLILTIIIFFILSIRFSFDKNEKFFSIEQTTALKGVSIFLVYIHHFGQIRCSFYNNHTFLGFLGVAVFLFISGYATLIQAEKKQAEWKKGYWGKKVKRLLIPRIIVVFVFGFLAGRTFKEGLTESFIFWQDWFLAAILFNYAIFYIAMSLKLPLVSFIFWCEFLFVCYCVVSGQLIMWYNTAFMFGFGVLFARHKERILNIISSYSRYKKYSIFVFLVLVICSMMRYQRFVFDTLTAIIFVLLVICYAKEKNFYSKVYAFLGTYSWEFYLVHSRIIGIVLNRFTNNNLLAFFIAFFISLSIAVILNKSLEILFSILMQLKDSLYKTKV